MAGRQCPTPSPPKRRRAASGRKVAPGRAAALCWTPLIAAGRSVGALLHRADAAAAGHKAVGPLAFLLIAGVIGVALVVGTVYTPSYVVSVDGVTLGVVSDPEVFEGAMERVEARASDILGYDYTLDNAVTYDFALTEKDKLSNVGDFETYLFDQIGEVMKSYVLKVNGQFIGAAQDEASLTAMLDAIKAPLCQREHHLRRVCGVRVHQPAVHPLRRGAGSVRHGGPPDRQHQRPDHL